MTAPWSVPIARARALVRRWAGGGARESGRVGAPAARADGAASGIPAAHPGMDYASFLAELAVKRGTGRYLEIGVNKGFVLERIPARIAVGVDPAFEIGLNVARRKSVVVLVQAGSDAFFADDGLKAMLGGPPDLSFLDGLHTFEYLLRDFANTERFGTRSSLIAMHDCFPLDGIMALRHFEEFRERVGESRFGGWWTGDVWKIVPILKTYRPDLRISCVNCWPTGLVLVTNLDPSSTVLQDRYLEIVDRFRTIANTEAELEGFYCSVEVLDAATVLKEHDHSLYFRV